MMGLDSEATIQDLKDEITLETLKELLYDMEHDHWIDNPDEYADACRLLIEYFGTPQKDYEP